MGVIRSAMLLRAFLLFIPLFIHCDFVAGPRTAKLSLLQIPDQRSNIIDTNYNYEPIAYSVSARGPTPIVYTLDVAPANATINASTGEFFWLPTAIDFGSHIVIVSATNGTDIVRDTFSIAVQAPVLRPGAVFKMIVPNGGETYVYGDTITSIWLQDPSICSNGMLKIDNGPLSCDYFEGGSHPKTAVDTTAAAVASGQKYFLVAAPTTFVGVCRVILVDRPRSFSGCGAKFSDASELRFTVYDGYAPPECKNCFDQSDGNITIVQ